MRNDLLKSMLSADLSTENEDLSNRRGPDRRGVVTDDGMRELGERIVAIRNRRGITQVQLAEQLGLTQSVISRMESGEQRIHGEMIVRLAGIFDVTTDEILGHQRKNVTSIDVPRRWIKRIQRIDGLSTREQDALALIIDAFLAKPKSKAAS
jgi:transcriptional regulator with XRE-family HTH domain